MSPSSLIKRRPYLWLLSLAKPICLCLFVVAAIICWVWVRPLNILGVAPQTSTASYALKIDFYSLANALKCNINLVALHND